MKDLTKKIISVALILSALGLIDAIYLTVNHYQTASVVCLLAKSCDAVLQSSYAAWGPIPVSLAGAVYYLAVFIFSLFSLKRKDDKMFLPAVFLIFAGLSATVWFLAVQIFILREFCSYCIFSAADTITLSVLGFMFLFGYNKKDA